MLRRIKKGSDDSQSMFPSAGLANHHPELHRSPQTLQPVTSYNVITHGSMKGLPPVTDLPQWKPPGEEHVVERSPSLP